MVGLPELAYVGEHGLELAPDAEAWRERLHDFAATVDWDDVEPKPLTVSFHYRRADGRGRGAAAARGGRRHAPAPKGSSPRFGRKVLELRPPLDAHKGTAVRALLEEAGLRRALYAGDDTTDLDAFAALEGLELAVRVAVASDEGPLDSARPPTWWSATPPSSSGNPAGSLMAPMGERLRPEAGFAGREAQAPSSRE